MPSCNTYRLTWVSLTLNVWASLHSCSSKAQPLLLTLDEGYLFTTAPPDLEGGVASLGPHVPAQPLLLGKISIYQALNIPHKLFWCLDYSSGFQWYPRGCLGINQTKTKESVPASCYGISRGASERHELPFIGSFIVKVKVKSLSCVRLFPWGRKEWVTEWLHFHYEKSL